MASIKRALQTLAKALARPLGGAGLRRWLLRRPVPPRDEVRGVPGCRAAVDIRIDRNGVPHIYAANAHDLFLAQGYCHARDRLWQMELNRHLARGELAELFGPRALPTDRLLRRFGFRRAAEKEATTLTGELNHWLEAYAAGVNAYTRSHRLPVEFFLLRKRPRPWTAIDSLAFARYMGWSMTANGESELIRQTLKILLDPERAAALEPLTGSWRAGDVSPPVPVPTSNLATDQEPDPVRTPFSHGDGAGSNAWAVAPSRSTTGRPLLANDPHLRPRMPAAWYMAHLSGGGFDVVGATLPGTLGVLVGHNAHVAWGITASLVDCQDVYEEQPTSSGSFAFGDGAEDAELVREEIRVRGRRAPVIEDVVRTRHGPLLNGCLALPDNSPPLALQCMTERQPTPLAATLALNRATDVHAIRTALADWTSPALNFVFADTAGNIGYQLAGRVPLRAEGDGSAPVPGWTGSHEWTGVVAFDDLPHALNPVDGFVATANSRPLVADVDAARVFLTRDWTDDFRQQRVLDLLQARRQHAPADFQAMQRDVVSLAALALARRLQEEAFAGDILNPLRDWDGRLDVDNVAASVYQVFRLELLRLAYRDLPAPARELVCGSGLLELLILSSVFHQQSSSLLLRLVDDMLGPENRAIGRLIVDDALRRTGVWLTERLGPDAAGWKWGRLHRVTFGHVLGLASPALDRLLRLNRGPVPVGGDLDTIAQSGVDPWHPFEAGTFTVSYRQVIDVGDWDAMRFILPTGQSGHPGSRHYDDMLDSWRRGDYRTLPFSRAAVEAETAETARLLPETAHPSA
jgi:penicillin amidase